MSDNNVKIELEKDIDAFMMMGQSNMAGRGRLGEVRPIDNPNCLMYRMSSWLKLQEPVNIDGTFGNEYSPGISIAGSFCEEYYNAFNKKCGVVPCAKGGTRICEWQPGEPLFENALLQAKFSMRGANLKGILWHQGEGDLARENADKYYDRFYNMITTFRNSLNMPNLPVFVGEISENISENWNITKDKISFSKDKKHLIIKISNDVTLLGFNLANMYQEKYNNYRAIFTLGKNNLISNKLSCKCIEVVGDNNE